MKKVAILSLHLGYGGIEKSIVALANMLAEKYDVEIVCTYKLYDKPSFPLDSKVKVKYLIKTDLPRKVSDYKVLLKQLEVKRLSKRLKEDYFSKGKVKEFFKDATIKDVDDAIADICRSAKENDGNWKEKWRL